MQYNITNIYIWLHKSPIKIDKSIDDKLFVFVRHNFYTIVLTVYDEY